MERQMYLIFNLVPNPDPRRPSPQECFDDGSTVVPDVGVDNTADLRWKKVQVCVLTTVLSKVKSENLELLTTGPQKESRNGTPEEAPHRLSYRRPKGVTFTLSLVLPSVSQKHRISTSL